MKARQVRLMPIEARCRRHRRLFMWSAVVACSLALAASLAVAGSGPIRVMLNGELLNEDLVAVVVDGVLMVPLEPITDALGAEFEYDAENRLVRISFEASRSGAEPREPSQQDTAPGDTVVFIAKSGTKYHRQDCRYLSSGGEAITLSVAKQRGYSPCKVCNPPK